MVLISKFIERWNRYKNECVYLRSANSTIALEKYFIRAENTRLARKNQKLLDQLPDGMKHCTIVFKACEVGHGRLHATNWIETGCLMCKIRELESKNASSV